MDRFDLSRRRVQITVDGLDISDYMLTWAVGREAIGFEAAPTISGEIVIGPIPGESLNPKLNGRWQPGNPVNLQIADDNDTLIDPPFGGHLIIDGASYQTDYTVLGAGARPEQLTLEVACKLGHRQEQDSPKQAGGFTFGLPNPIGALLNQILLTKNWGLSPQPGDPDPGSYYLYAPTFNGQSSLIDWVHRRLWCQPEASFGLWADSNGNVRIFEADTSATPIVSLAPEQVPSLVPITEQRERLPGKIKATATETIVSTRPSSSSYSSIAEDTEGTVIGMDRVNWELTVFAETTETRKYRRKGAALQGAEFDNDAIFESERTETEKEFDQARRNETTTTTVWQPEGNVDPDKEGSVYLIPAQETRVINRFGYSGVITDRRTITKKARGLLNLEGTATELVIEQIFYESWDKIGKIWRYYPRMIYNADVQRLNQYSGSVPSGGGPGSRPPGPDTRPELFDIEERQIEATVNLSYVGGSTITGEIRSFGTASLAEGTYTFTGYGAYASTLARLNWDGTGTAPAGTFTEIIGSYSGTGFFRGTGSWQGTGTWSGQRQTGRELPIDFEDHPPNQWALRRVATTEGRLITGRYHGVELELSLSDFLFELPPARTIAVGEDLYLLSGEVLQGTPDQCTLQATGLWIGKYTGGGFEPAVNVLQSYLSTQGGILDLSNQAGEEILT